MSLYALVFKVELDTGNNATVIDKEHWMSRVFVTSRTATYCSELTYHAVEHWCLPHT